MKANKLIIALLLAFGLSFNPTANAQHVHRAKTSQSHRAKTVHVRSYKTKKGKYVSSYNRAPPRRK